MADGSRIGAQTFDSTYVVIWHDELGLPRAWGAANDHDLARQRADDERDEYERDRPSTRLSECRSYAHNTNEYVEVRDWRRTRNDLGTFGEPVR